MTDTQFDLEAFARDVDERFTEVLARLAGDDRPLYTPDSLAVKLQASRRTVMTMLNRGEIPSFRIGGLRRITAASVDEYIARQAASDD